MTTDNLEAYFPINMNRDVSGTRNFKQGVWSFYLCRYIASE